MVKVKVEKTQVFVPDKELPFYPYSHDIVYIYEKRGREYELKTTLEGKDYFEKVTSFLKEHGKKLRGGMAKTIGGNTTRLTSTSLMSFC